MFVVRLERYIRVPSVGDRYVMFILTIGGGSVFRVLKEKDSYSKTMMLLHITAIAASRIVSCSADLRKSSSLWSSGIRSAAAI